MPDDAATGAPRAETEAIAELLQELLRRTHLSTPSDIAAAVADQAATIGATDVAVCLIDYEHAILVPVPGATADVAEPYSVTGTLPGRAFSTTAILKAPPDDAGRQRLWFPLLDGTERLGTLGMTFAQERVTQELVAACERYAHLVALLIATKASYGDAFERVRRRQPMTIASELVWALAPPLVFATDDLILAGMLEPAYDNGGDALDYAVNDRVLHLAVFDAMGHGLAAAGAAAFAVSAYRHSRRAGHDLLQTHAAMDEAVGKQFPDDRFVTAVIAQLDLDSGRLTWVSAGHPPPLLIRDGRGARSLPLLAAPPLGVDAPGDKGPAVGEESLEPRDLLLFYTDGLIEARGPDGSRFTLDDVSGFIEREVAGGQTAPETLRRIRHGLLGREQAELRDDASALLVEWRSDGERAFMPQTVLT